MAGEATTLGLSRRMGIVRGPTGNTAISISLDPNTATTDARRGDIVGYLKPSYAAPARPVSLVSGQPSTTVDASIGSTVFTIGA